MAFGQSAGPPATSKQLRELLELVIEAGHLDFRDARGPLGLTQRQAAGKFTRDEADELIAQLQEQTAPGDDEGSAPTAAGPDATAPRPKRSGANTSSQDEGRLRHVPAEELAAELQRRGWAVLEP
jgi:hypothetical protein